MTPREYKLIVTGTMGAGKTTAIAAISEIPPVRTEAHNTDRHAHAKETTTTALDYGEVTLAGGDKLRLYGTPGQERFDFMWRILAKGAIGVIVLVDNSRPAPLEDLRQYASAFAEAIRTSSAVIGIGRSESHPAPGVEAYCAVLDELGLSVPVFSVDVRRREDVLLLLEAILMQIEAEAAVAPR